MAKPPETPPMIGPTDGVFFSRLMNSLHQTHALKVAAQTNIKAKGIVRSHRVSQIALVAVSIEPPMTVHVVAFENVAYFRLCPSSGGRGRYTMSARFLGRLSIRTLVGTDSQAKQFASAVRRVVSERGG